ncbi:MAG: hypothetical protein GXP32_08210 [Kiritimatiellaeota bacterium]|nr:hypothetical protein [Kiritimatiellota bacterium]
MTSKMMICAVAVFSMAFAGVATERAAENLGKDTNSPVDASQARKAREIKEINSREKAKNAQENKNLTDKKKADKAVSAEVKKDEADAEKDAAAAKAKAAKELKNGKAAKNGGSSWFSWMWPFGSNEKKADEKKKDSGRQLDIVEVKADKTVVAEPTPDVDAAQAAVKEPEIVAEKQTATESEDDSPGFGRVLLLYLPNVLLDLSDIFTLGLSIGSRAGATVKVTRWCQFGGTYGEDYFVEKAFDRQIGGGYEKVVAFQLAALAGESSYVDAPFGTVQEYILKESKARVLSPNDEVYENKVRDFWAIGATAGWLVNVKAYVHPVEIADFVLGLFFIDFRDDDIQ